MEPAELKELPRRLMEKAFMQKVVIGSYHYVEGVRTPGYGIEPPQELSVEVDSIRRACENGRIKHWLHKTIRDNMPDAPETNRSAKDDTCFNR